MSRRPKSSYSQPACKEAFIPDPALNNPLRISTASKFDSLLNSEVGQKMFSRPNSKSRVTKSSSASMKPEVSNNVNFINKMQNTAVRTGLKTSSSNPVLDTTYEKAHQEFTEINNLLRDMQKKQESDLDRFAQAASPNRRKTLMEGLKETQKKCRSLKDARLTIIKRQRIAKNEHPDLRGFEVYNWQDIKRKEKIEQVNESNKQIRNRRLSTIHYVDPALSLKPQTELKIEGKKGVRILSSTMPFHYHNTSSIFSPSSPIINQSRLKTLTEKSHGSRDFNIITGAYLK